MKINEYDIYAETQRLSLTATTAIERAMKHVGLKRSEIADALGVQRSRVTKVLDGEVNMTLKTLASFGLACGIRWEFLGMDAETHAVTLPFAGWLSEFDFIPDEQWMQVVETETTDSCSSASSREAAEPEGPL